MLTYRDLQLRVLSLMDEADSTADSTLTIVKDALQASHRRLCNSRLWPFLLWPNEEALVTVAGQRTYALNRELGKLIHVFDDQMQTFLPVIPRRDWEGLGIDRVTQAGTPPGVIFGGTWPVPVQPVPSLTAGVTISSSLAGDFGSSFGVHFRGLDEEGQLQEEVVSAAGTSLMSTNTNFNYLINVTKIGDWAGFLYVDDSAGNRLLTMRTNQSALQFPTLEFVETPSGANRYRYQFQRNPRTLTEDYEIPETPFPYSEFHVYDALVDIATYNTELGMKEIGLWQKRAEQIYTQLVNSFDEAIVGSAPRFIRDLDGGWGQRGVVMQQ